MVTCHVHLLRVGLYLLGKASQKHKEVQVGVLQEFLV